MEKDQVLNETTIRWNLKMLNMKKKVTNSGYQSMGVVRYRIDIF